MARLYADENFPFPVVEALRLLGHYVLTIGEDGRANRRVTDEEVLARATALGRALLTTNRRDFLTLHAATPEHAGLILCTFDRDFARQASRIDAALHDMESLSGNVIRINRPAE